MAKELIGCNYVGPSADPSKILDLSDSNGLEIGPNPKDNDYCWYKLGDVFLSPVDDEFQPFTVRSQYKVSSNYLFFNEGLTDEMDGLYRSRKDYAEIKVTKFTAVELQRNEYFGDWAQMLKVAFENYINDTFKKTGEYLIEVFAIQDGTADGKRKYKVHLATLHVDHPFLKKEAPKRPPFDVFHCPEWVTHTEKAIGDITLEGWELFSKGDGKFTAIPRMELQKDIKRYSDRIPMYRIDLANKLGTSEYINGANGVFRYFDESEITSKGISGIEGLYCPAFDLNIHEIKESPSTCLETMEKKSRDRIEGVTKVHKNGYLIDGKNGWKRYITATKDADVSLAEKAFRKGFDESSRSAAIIDQKFISNDGICSVYDLTRRGEVPEVVQSMPVATPAPLPVDAPPVLEVPTSTPETCFEWMAAQNLAHTTGVVRVHKNGYLLAGEDGKTFYITSNSDANPKMAERLWLRDLPVPSRGHFIQTTHNVIKDDGTCTLYELTKSEAVRTTKIRPRSQPSDYSRLGDVIYIDERESDPKKGFKMDLIERIKEVIHTDDPEMRGEICFAVDRSGSMFDDILAVWSQFGEIEGEMKRYTPDSNMCLVSFGGPGILEHGTKINVKLDTDRSRDEDLSLTKDKLHDIMKDTNGWCEFTAVAARRAVKEIERSDKPANVKKIVIITDECGNILEDGETIADVSAHAKARDIEITTIFIGGLERCLESKCDSRSGGCFTAGAKLYLEGGGEMTMRSLMDLYEKGSDLPKIATLNESTMQVEYQTPSSVIPHEQKDWEMLHINYGSGEFDVTPNHGLATLNDAGEIIYRPAGEFFVGETLITRNGPEMIESISDLQVHSGIQVYNIHFDEGNHNYFVDGIVAHNFYK